MMRSLYSAIAGLKANQTKMDVIGNNIANVNTVGFKASSVTFSDVYYQTLQSASGSSSSSAGTNAKQVGLGTKVASILSSITTAGGAESTGNTLDLMISGNSFFVVNSGGTNYFTKDGSFTVDSNGTLCTSSGAKVMGWQVDPDNEDSVIKTTVSALNILSPENLYSEPEATTNAYFTGNVDTEDSAVAYGADGTTTTLSFYDSLGNSYTAVFSIVQTEDATNNYTVTLSDILDSNNESIFVSSTTDTDGTVTYDASAITSVTFGGTTYTVSDVDEDTGELTLTTSGTTYLNFDADTGKFSGVGSATTSTDDSVSFTINSGEFETIDVDFSTLTQYANGGSSTVSGYAGSVEDDGSVSEDGAGHAFGAMTGYSIDSSGKIYGSYSNGESKLLGQIAVASFTNPYGLESVGDNLYAESLNSGSFDGIGHDVTSDGGSMTSGYLEASNVDLATEFTQMIVTQRAYQANSRIITTTDSMLEELVNLKR